MQQLTSQGQSIVNDLAARHGFSTDAVTHMLFAVLNGNGSQAQFCHNEFGGSGQWMRGGMIMLGDMFNNYLKGRVDNLCSEIGNLLANQPGLLRSGSFQSQSQSGGGYQNQGSGAPMGGSSLFVPDPEDNWWPQDLGSPNATGAQNNVRYAYFANARRLAVKTGGEVWVYDTLDHNIGGFSQQQGYGSDIVFGSQYGTVILNSLPLVSRNGQAVPPPAPQNNFQPNFAPQPMASQPAPAPMSSGSTDDIFAAIDKLGSLRDKGFISDDEFAAKKTELLSRL